MSRVARPSKIKDAAAIGAASLCEESGTFEHKRTSVAEAGVQKPVGVPSSAFDAGRMATPSKKTVPLLDPNTVVIEQGLEPPVNGTRLLSAAYLAVLAKMSEGSSVVLPHAQAVGLSSVARKRGKKTTSRVLGDGRTRVWLLAGKPEERQRKKAPFPQGARS